MACSNNNLSVLSMMMPVGYIFYWTPTGDGLDLSTPQKVHDYFGFGTWKLSCGRNLIVGASAWTMSNPVVSPSTWDGYTYIGGSAYLENGKTYTLQAVSDSVWATEHQGPDGTATIWINKSGYHRCFCGDGVTSGRYCWTFVHNDNTDYYQIRINGYNKATKFWNIKIESGSEATNWSPAPEDIGDSYRYVYQRIA